MNEKKKCSKCGIEKELCEYHKFKHSKDGVKNICKLCISITNKMPENRIKRNQTNKIWRENNKEKVRGYKLKEYEKNKELILLRNKEFRLKNSIPYEDDLESWFWVYFGYDYASKKAFTFVRFYDRIISHTFNGAMH